MDIMEPKPPEIGNLISNEGIGKRALNAKDGIQQLSVR